MNYDDNDIKTPEYSFSNVEKLDEQLLIEGIQELWDKIHGKPSRPVWKEEKDTEYPTEFWKVVREWINERKTGVFDKKSEQELDKYMEKKIKDNPPGSYKKS